MIRVNGADVEFVDETIVTLLSRRNIDSRGVAVAVNGEIIRRSEWSATHVTDGANVEIVTAAAGG